MTEASVEKAITSGQIIKALHLAADRNLAALGRLPMAQLTAVTARLQEHCLPEGELGRGKALHLLLQDALERLRPGDDDEMAWRPYRIVQARLAGRSVVAASLDLGLTADGFQATQRTKAIPAFRSALWELEQEACATHRTLFLERNLPPPTYTRLFGVDRRMEQALEALADPHGRWLVAIDGLGGLGKTALAHAVARQIAQSDRFAGLAWETARQATFVWGEIRPSSRPALTLDALLEAIARQLDWADLSTLPPVTRKAALTERLKRRPYLVVVDNLETASDYESLADTLWGLANPSKFLLTSRHRLHGYEQVYSISLRGLPEPDGMAFIRHHAAERGIEALAEAGDDILLQIQRVTGGNPLAIKLVVGQLAQWPLRQVLADLETIGGSADQFYHYLYSYSWQRLSPPAQELLLNMLHLSITGGDWADLQAISGLDDKDLGWATSELIACSLLNVGGGVEKTYSIHRLTHHFLVSQSETEGQWEAFQAGARRAGAHALDYMRVHQGDAAALDRQRDNLLQAMSSCYHHAQAWEIVVACALQAHDYMVRAGHWQIWDEFLTMSMEAACQAEDQTNKARLLIQRGELKRRLGQWDRAQTLHQTAIPILEQLDMRQELGRAYRCLGDVCTAQGDRAAALAHFERALALLAGIDSQDLAHTHLSLAGTFWHQGDTGQSRTHAQAAQALYAQLADPAGQARATVTLGLTCVSYGDYDEAETHYRQALALYDQAQDEPPKVRALINLGYLLFLKGDWPAALEHYEQALALAGRVGDRPNTARLHNLIGIILARQARLGEALAHYHAAESFMTEIGDEPFLAGVHFNVGMVRLKQGDADQARARLEAALAIFERVGNEGEAGNTWHGLGQLYSALEEWPQALACYRRTLDIGERLGDPVQTFLALLYMGRVYLATGDDEALASCLQRTESLATQLARPEMQAQAAWLGAQAHAARGNVEDARAAYEQALSLARQDDTYQLRQLQQEIQADLSALYARLSTTSDQ